MTCGSAQSRGLGRPAVVALEGVARAVVRIDEIRKGRTALIVSHRVSSVKDADTIIVIDAGRIVERGTHDELLEQDGYYANLYRRQTLEEEIAEIA